MFSTGSASPAWVVTGFNAGACSPPHTRLYRETGAAWRQLPPSRLPQIGVIEAVSNQVAYALAATNGNGGFDSVVRSIDGGRTWQGV